MNVVNMVAPEGAVDLLAERYRISLDKTKGGRELWVEGTLELVVVVAEARSQYHHTIDYGRWLERNGLRAISMQDLSAFNQFAKNLTYARQLLEQSRSWSWREVWSKRPDKPKRPANGAPSGSGKGPISRTLHNASGARKRKRSNVIPTVMRDDYEPGSVMRALAANPAAPLVKRGRRRRGLANDPPVTRLKVGKLVGLTPQEVDPDFVGTPLQFTTKYGHVTLHTKQQIEENKRQEALQTWLGLVGEHGKTARSMLTVPVDVATLQEWLSKPGKAQKYQMWLNDIQHVCENLRRLSGDQPVP